MSTNEEESSRLTAVSKSGEEFSASLIESTPKSQLWYRKEVIQTAFATLFFASITSIIVTLSAMYAQRLTTYFWSRQTIEVDITSEMLRYSAQRLQTESKLLTSEQRDIALTLSKNLEYAATELTVPQHFVLKSFVDSAPLWLQFAISEYIHQNMHGVKYNERILKYVASIDSKLAKPPSMDGLDWSAHFVNWVMEKAGVTATDIGTVDSWLYWGKAIMEPKRGAVVILASSGRKGLKTVGLVIADTPNYVIVVMGDVVDLVSVVAFNKTSVLGYRWPNGG